ncbi:MAG TPA: hypothetical protein VNV86_04575, partial [Candidatus Acidoferrum sp.]|nr:hypothetical protein [Candidatus Acidoferrum sp.]
KIRARDAKLKDQAENERMMKLYKEHVLKEQPTNLVSIAPLGASPIAPAPKPVTKPVEEKEEVGSFGD